LTQSKQEERIFGKYRLERRHITVTVLMFIFFVIVLMILQRSSIHDMLSETQRWYRQQSAELLANTNSTALELLVKNMKNEESITAPEKNRLIQAFNIILTQQKLERNINDVCILVQIEDSVYAIDNGRQLFNFFNGEPIENFSNEEHKFAVDFFKNSADEIFRDEKIISSQKFENNFDILVPFAPNGELVGVFYLQSNPDFSSIASEFLTNYNQIAIVFLSLILLGILTLYYLTSYTVEERDKARKKFFEEHQEHLKAEIEHEKEAIFTKRIYHTHHKAEKVMGFIKEDLRDLNSENIDQTKEKVNKYANFVAHAIYDMKWYDPPINTIRNPIFNTDINNLIKFIVENIFLRISSKMENIHYDLNLDDNLPKVIINEFVVWEILEPLIQNSIDHAPDKDLIISITTKYDAEKSESQIIISDNGNGLQSDLLETDENGIQKVFLENVTTKNVEERRAGYGCYIAYELAVKRCGWKLSAANNDEGCRFTITIKT